MMTTSLPQQPKKRSYDVLTNDDLTADTINKQTSSNDFFLQPHTFSDLKITLANGAIVHADKSVLSAASPIFQAHFQANPSATNIDVVDIKLSDFLVLLQFLYPQFDCTITRANINFLLEMSERFHLSILYAMCRNFTSIYLSKIIAVKTATSNGKTKNKDLILFEDGTQVTAQSELPLLISWLRAYSNEMTRISPMTKAIIDIVDQCSTECLRHVLNMMSMTDSIEYSFQVVLYKARARYLEKTLHHQVY